MVSTATIAFIILAMVLGIAIPVILCVFIRSRYKAPISSFFIGCAVMFVFAFILEQIAHTVILGSAVGEKIQNNLLLYALYGGFMAGLFEETGRFLAMRYALKKHHDKPHTAIMYGAGHGGFEAFAILTIGMLNNLIYSIMLNNNMVDMLTASLDANSKAILESSLNALINTPSWHFLLSPVERILAITLQISMSVIVWIAASGQKSRIRFYIYTILIHMVIDSSTVLCAKKLPILAVEGVIALLAVAVTVLAVCLWKRYLADSEELNSCCTEPPVQDDIQ